MTLTYFRSVATLSGLAVAGRVLSPAFSAATTEYQVAVPNSQTTVQLTPAVADNAATVTVAGNPVTSGEPVTVDVAVGTTQVPVVVTAEDGTTTKTYTVAVTRTAPTPVVTTPPPTTTTAPPTVPAPTTTPQTTPPPVPATPTPSLTLGKAVGAGRGKTVSVDLTTNVAGTVEAVGTHTKPKSASSRAAGTLVPGPGRLAYAQRTPTSVKAGKVRLVLQRTAAGRRAKYKARVITLRVVVKLTPNAGKAVRVTKNVRVRIR